MTIHSAGAANARSAPFSWLLKVGNAVMIAAFWCYHLVWTGNKPAAAKKRSRSEEKQRRKALVREMQKRG